MKRGSRCGVFLSRLLLLQVMEGSVTESLQQMQAGEHAQPLRLGRGPSGIPFAQLPRGSGHSLSLIATVTQEPTRLVTDVNGDGAINIQDLVFVASRLGQAGENPADVNGDGFVNIQDLVFVAGELGGDAAAPAAWHHTSLGVPMRATVEEWLLEARRLPLTDARSQRGVLFVGTLLRSVSPGRDSTLVQLPEPVQPGDVDPLPSCGAGRCNVDDLFCGW